MHSSFLRNSQLSNRKAGSGSGFHVNHDMYFHINMKRTLALVALLALSNAVPAQDAKRQPDLLVTTTAGVTFSAPTDWSLAQTERTVVLTPPETDSTMALVDIKAKDADSALAAAWA